MSLKVLQQILKTSFSLTAKRSRRTAATVVMLLATMNLCFRPNKKRRVYTKDSSDSDCEVVAKKV